MLAGRFSSLVPVLPSVGTCCRGGPGLLFFGPLPSSAAWATGFGGWFERAALFFEADVLVVAACCGFDAGRFWGASTCTGGSVVDFSWACPDAGISVDSAAQKNPAQR